MAKNKKINPEDEKKIEKLKKEIKSVQLEIEILKKANSYFKDKK